jgi:hypothetical protein
MASLSRPSHCVVAAIWKIGIASWEPWISYLSGRRLSIDELGESGSYGGCAVELPAFGQICCT